MLSESFSRTVPIIIGCALFMDLLEATAVLPQMAAEFVEPTVRMNLVVSLYLLAGLLTLAGGAGALTIKFLSVRIVKRFGFRRILLGNSVLAGLSIALCAIFDAQTPYALIVVLLFVGGVIRSLQFSTLGALTFLDVPVALASRASSLSAMSMLLNMSLAIGLAAVVLSAIMNIRGHVEIQASGLSLTMLLCGLLCASSWLLCRRLGRQAGGSVTD